MFIKRVGMQPKVFNEKQDSSADLDFFRDFYSSKIRPGILLKKRVSREFGSRGRCFEKDNDLTEF